MQIVETVSALNDPALVRREYADERGLAARMAAQSTATGADPYSVVFDGVAEGAPGLILEVGCGRGELAERMSRELDARVVAVDQSERMVELTRQRGVEAIVGDVQDLPFRDGIFDAAVAAWMLYHAADLELALRELRRVLRPDGRLVAATSSERNLHELWELVGEIGAPADGFTAENAEWALLRHFTIVDGATCTAPSGSPTATRPLGTSRRCRRAATSPTACPTSRVRSTPRGTWSSSSASRDHPRRRS